MSRRNRVQNRIGGSTGEGLSTAERAIRQQAQPVLEAVARNAAQKVLVMPQAQLDLNRVDLGDAPRFFDLPDGHVAEADGADAAVTLEGGERAHAGRKRHARVGAVELIQGDAIDAECTAAGLAGCDQMPGAAVGLPPSIGPDDAPFGGDRHARAIPRPCRQGACDETLVVAPLGLVPAVRIRGVEQSHASVEGGVQSGDGGRLVAVWLR